MFRRSARLIAAVLSLSSLVVPARAFATATARPGSRVYATAKDGKILRIDFATASTEVVNTDFGTGTRLGGLVLRDDGTSGVQLFAARSNDGVFLYPDPLTGVAGQLVASRQEIGRANALALDAAGTLFVVSPGSDDDGCRDDRGQVFRLSRGGNRAGGYGEPFLIDGSLTNERLEDAEVVRFNDGGLHSGDLLVLARERTTVYRYPNAASCTPAGACPRTEFIPKSAFPNACAKPSGFAFLGHTLLVALESGTILRYGPGGARILPDFASGLGSGRFGVAVGGDGFVYVSRKLGYGDSVKRFTVASDGTGVLKDRVAANRPAAVDVTTSSNAPFHAGSTEQFATTTVSEIKCGGAGWAADGSISGNVLVFEDPREKEPAALSLPSNVPLHRELRLRDIDATLPDMAIPTYVRAFRVLAPGQAPTDAPLGPYLHILVRMDSTVKCTDPPELHGFEETVYGYDPSLDVPTNRTAEPRWFYSPETDAPKNEPPILESPGWFESTSGVGSTRGHTRDTSLFLHARDTRPLDGPGSVSASGDCLASQGVADCALNKLREAVQACTPKATHFSCIKSKTLGKLRREVQDAISAFECKNYTEARHEIEDVDEIVLANLATSFASCQQREAQELRSRALSLIYKLQKLEAHP